MNNKNIREEIKNHSKIIPIVTLHEKERRKSFKFYSPNAMALWRAESLYTKEPVTINWIKQFQKNKIFYDIDANVGMYTIFASIFSEVKVFSFLSPESNNYQILNQNIRMNSLSEKVVAYPFGISDSLSLTKTIFINLAKSRIS